MTTPGGRGITWPLWPLYRPAKVSDGADGLWKITHEVTEHGVFYISIYICEQKDEKGGQPHNCTLSKENTADESALVPGTGLDQGNDKLPSSAFTICPQNTQSTTETTQHQVVVGQQLDDCHSAVNFYSPKGAGHIAERCLEGFACSIPGMRWPVATPGYWVDDKNPSTMRKCVTKGACPGSEQFVTTDQCPSPLLFDEPNATSGPVAEYAADKLDFGKAGQPPFMLQQGCFMLPGEIGVNQRAERTGQPFLEKECYMAVGHRCCPGATGPKCNLCCTKDMGVGHGSDNATSCNGKQWHSKGTGEGQHCQECPDPKVEPLWIAFVFLMALMVLPILVKVSELAKHAGAVSGPLLSVLNFIQSADLFQGLDLHWPQFFKDLCRNVAALFNSLNIFTGLMKWLDLPNPECAFQLTYVQKWCSIMLTPLIIIVSYFTITIIWILIWRVMRVGTVWNKGAELLHDGCVKLKMCKRPEAPPEQRLVDQIGQFQPEPEPEPEPEYASLKLSMGNIKSGKLSQSSKGCCGDETGAHGWQFRMWHNGSGSWQDFDRNDQRTLSEADALELKTLELKRGEFTYEVRLDTLQQINQVTHRVRKIRRPARGWIYRCRLTRFYAEHSWDSTVQGLIRFMLLYLLVGYTFLAGTALEPIACKADLDTTGRGSTVNPLQLVRSG